MPSPLIALQQVSRFYPSGLCNALCEVTLTIKHHEKIAIVGPSGSGKSTLLHILCGLDRPTRGRVLFEGREFTGARSWAEVRARRIGFVFQAFNLLPTLTAEQNVEVPMYGIVRSAKKRRVRALQLLARVGLSARACHRPNELSGGEKQRLAIARSLANSPDVILADEPTGNLDSKNAAEILQLLEDIHSTEGATVVVVTHDFEISRRMSRVIALRDGRVIPPDSGMERI